MMQQRHKSTGQPGGGSAEVVEANNTSEVGEVEEHKTIHSHGSVQTFDKAAELVEGVTVNQAVTVQPGKRGVSTKTDNGISNYDDVEIKETEYLYFPWFIRGKLTAVQGDSDTGKSTLLYCIGAYVTTGRDIFGVRCESPGNVMFVTLEDDESDIKTAFLDSGGDARRIRRITDRNRIAALNFQNQNDLDYVARTIRENSLTFLVFDPIQAYLGGDINKANDTRPQMAALAKIAADTGCAIAFIQHTGKDTTRQGIHKGLGSVDIVAASRSLIQVSSDPEDESLIIAYTVKNNTASKVDTQKAIAYKICDHPGAVNSVTGKHHHYHGHAELTGIINKYNERIHKERLARAAARGEQVDYESDPLVLTVRELVRGNPDGLFIWYEELIASVTDFCGSCPYTMTKDKRTGLKNRINSIRGIMIERDKIQMDAMECTESPIVHKLYHWNGHIISDDSGKKKRGVDIKVLNGSKNSFGTENTIQK